MRKVCRLLLLFSALGAALTSSPARAEILRLHEVAPGIYRGSMPEDLNDFALLKDLGIRTLYTLVTNTQDIEREQKLGAAMGMTVVSVPVNPLGIPSNKKIDFLLEQIQDPRNQPAFLHCRHGKDRTGLVFGIFRVEVQGWSPQKAYDEMIDIGFNPWLLGLKYAFWRRMDRNGHTEELTPLTHDQVLIEMP